jgi:hypothetical protein
VSESEEDSSEDDDMEQDSDESSSSMHFAFPFTLGLIYPSADIDSSDDLKRNLHPCTPMTLVPRIKNAN